MSNIKLFDKWDYDVEVLDTGLQPYICLDPMIVPHSGGKHAKKKFWKTEKTNIVERLVNKIMRSAQGSKKFSGKYLRGAGSTGKKTLAIKIVEEAFEKIHKKTNDNPVQVLVDAVQNAASREETTTIIYGGVRYHQSVDISPQRRVDLGLKNITIAAYANAFNTKNDIVDCLVEEIVNAANNDPKSYAIKKKEEAERIAQSSR